MLLLMYSSPNVSSNILLNHVSNVTIVSLSTFRKLYDNSTTKTTIALLNKTALSVFTEASYIKDFFNHPPLQVTLTRIGAEHCRASSRLPTHEPAKSNIL